MSQPLILVTNDDGIDSAGLQAAVDVLAPLGEVLVAAPDRQWSGAGRAMPRITTGTLEEVEYASAAGKPVHAYAIDASPALCVIHAMLELVPRRPALVVSGINFGENVSTEITISGTIGAALEGAAFGLPALAVSMEMEVSEHLVGSETEDYAAAKAYTAHFAGLLLARKLPFDVDLLSINIPRDASPETPWCLTRLSRRRYFLPLKPERAAGTGRPGYRRMDNPAGAEEASDVWCLHGPRLVSVTPLSLDMTARVDFGALEELLS